MPVANIYDENIPDVGGAIIGYASAVSGYIEVANTALAAGEVLIPNTYDQLILAGTETNQTIALEIPEGEYLNYVAIAGHNLNSAAYRLDVTKTISPIPGTDYIAQAFPLNNRPLLLEIEPYFARNNEFIVFSFTSGVTVADDQDIYLGNVFVGEYLKMPTPIFIGQDIPNYADNSDREIVMSENGEMIGRTVDRRGNKATFTFNNVSIEWYKKNFMPFVEHARTKPFFIKWRPDRFTNETCFGYIKSDIKATISNGALGLINISFSMSIENDI